MNQILRDSMCCLWMAFIAVCAVAEGASWKVESPNGVPLITRDGQAVTSRMYWGNLYYAGHPNGVGSPMPDVVRLALNSGVELISVEVHAPFGTSDAADFAEMEHLCDTLLKLSPKIQLIPRVKLYAPPWWIKKYPEEMMKFDNGTIGIRGNAVSVASERYRRDAAEAMRQTIRFLEKRFPGRIAGYHPAGGNSAEWFYWGSQTPMLNGYDVPTLKRFKAWLKKKYGTDEALATAWHRPGLTVENATVPTPQERRVTTQTGLRRPLDGQNVIDFVHFQNDDMAEMVMTIGRVIREECGLHRLSLLFFGYIYELSNLHNGPGNSGHMALRKVLDSNLFDIFTAPFSYGDRTLAGSGAVMAPAESIMLAGKLWLNEDDTSTHIAAEQGNRAPGWDLGAKTPEESQLLLRRNLLMTFSRRYGIWWMDLNDHGWFNSRLLWTEMDRLIPLEREYLRHPIPFRPEIAVLADPDSMQYLTGQRSAFFTTRSSVALMRKSVSKVATQYGLYLQDDLTAGKLSAKLNIFCSTLALDAIGRQKLRDAAKKAGALWIWAPGYIDLDTGDFSLEAVRDLTGFRVREVDVPDFSARATLAGREAGLPLLFGSVPYGPTREHAAVRPVLSPIPEKDDVVLACYRDGSPAVVFRPGIRPAFFSGPPEVPTELIRFMAKKSGVALASDQDLNCYYDDSFFACHAPADGIYTIDPHRKIVMKDVLTGELLPPNRSLVRRLRCGETVLLVPWEK